jgi:hypothetical protein
MTYDYWHFGNNSSIAGRACRTTRCSTSVLHDFAKESRRFPVAKKHEQRTNLGRKRRRPTATAAGSTAMAVLRSRGERDCHWLIRLYAGGSSPLVTELRRRPRKRSAIARLSKMRAGRTKGMGKRSSRRDRENQASRTAPRARVSVLDLIRASPYGPAASVKPHQEAEHTSAPDHMPPEAKISLASTGASTHVRPDRPGKGRRLLVTPALAA